MTNKIEEIIAEQVSASAEVSALQCARNIEAALDAAGLGVRPENPTQDMIIAGRGHLVPVEEGDEELIRQQERDDTATYQAYWRAFDPHKWKPAE